ncbi:hypothetical protein BU23DRAFT_580989 [Bimuria novae-zelandiae CBS 107.79]|uniref:Amino acid transporter n=1 Tax=Bimuria novae-zelandiae CBS 107.79 TaxID=1447943 RepID=A0A6A5V6W6_9PLEO|nr:hypothetical protein BU23DRAFT_580989 [Bimuria novae-zelandiae CBS 107.79]
MLALRFLEYIDDDSSFNSVIFEILLENISNSIITKAPEERFRLGYWTVVGLIVNRVIGTGIFDSPTTIMIGTSSTGVTLLFWAAGAVYTIAGAYLSVEFGLTTPRHKFEGMKQGIPRSGETLNYPQYVLPWPAYRHRTVLLITCMYAAAYIVLGNMAGNYLIFGIRILEAANKPLTNSEVRELAVAAATFGCAIHTFSRRGGIWLGNVLAIVKVCMLLMMVIISMRAWGGVFGVPNVVEQNLAAQNSFAKPSKDPYVYAKAFLCMIFAWSGFDQPNSVLGEVGRLRKKMIVAPKEEQTKAGGNVALASCERTLGTVSKDKLLPNRIRSAFMAISSLSNIVVMNFLAARVKQEIVKEGIIPWPKFFGETKKPLLPSMSPQEHSQTPFGALFLHWFFTVLLIAVTSHLTPTGTYTLLVDLYAYTVVSVFGFVVGIGMLRLRLSKTKSWATKSPFWPILSIISALIFALGSGCPMEASWIPPSSEYIKKTPSAVAWSTTPVQKVPEFDRDPPSNGPPVQVHETVFLAWVAKENESTDVEMEERRSMESF